MHIFPEYNDIEKDIKSLMPNGGDEAEAELYKLLKDQLPENWYVVHNVHFSGKRGENQIDFLIIANGTENYPNAKGIVNFECKGKSYKINGNGTFQFPDGSYCDPVGQSMTAISNFYNTLKNQEFDGNDFCVYGRAVVFPTRPINAQESTALNAHKNWIFDEKDCDNICGIVDKILGQARENLKTVQRVEYPAELTLENAEKIYYAFSQQVILEKGNKQETLKKFRDLGIRLSKAQEVQRTNDFMKGGLTFVQSLVLKDIFRNEDNQPVHISGGAGTGKTWIGFAAAEKFLKEKGNEAKRVLYVCYNSCLAAYLNLKYAKNNLVVTSFFRLPYICFTKNTARSIFSDDMVGGSNWKENVPKMMQLWDGQNSKDINSLFKKFDMVIVDEAQDFSADMLNFMFRLKTENGKILFLSDKAQSIYEKNPVIESVKSYPLDINIRNTKPIDEFSCKPLELQTSSETDGVEVEEKSGNKDVLLKCIDKIVSQYSTSQIAILSDSAHIINDIQYSEYKFNSPASGFEATKERLKQWQANNEIWKSTVHAFKGLEAECVIYVKTNNVGNEQTKIDYIGETRAKLQLIVFTLEN